MKALLLKNKKLNLKEIPKPEPDLNEALIKVLKAGICNTDIEILKGYMDFEGVLGHEFVGRVIKAKDKKLVGKRVVGEINIGCGVCDYCLNNKINHCPWRKVLGILNKDGVFAEFTTLPISNLHSVPEEISNEKAVFVEPLASVLRILEQIEIKKRDKVLILGDGKLGLLIAQVVRLTTKETYCIGKHNRKLRILEGKGIKTYHLEENIKEKFDIVIEATGKKEGVNYALKYIKPEGKIILKSTFHGKVNFDLSYLVIHEINLIGSRCGPFDKALNFLKNDLIDVESLIDGEYPLNEWKKAFTEAQKNENLKILFKMD